MKIGVSRLRRPMTWYGLPLAAWTLYWASAIWTDVRTETAIGQGEALLDVAAHDVFQLVFVVAHGGVRWLAGMAALLVVGGAVRVLGRPGRRGRFGTDGPPLTVGPSGAMTGPERLAGD